MMIFCTWKQLLWRCGWPAWAALTAHLSCRAVCCRGLQMLLWYPGCREGVDVIRDWLFFLVKRSAKLCARWKFWGGGATEASERKALRVELRLNGVHVLDQAHFKIILNIFIQHRLVVDIFQQLRDIVRSLLQVQAEGLNKFCVNLYLLDSLQLDRDCEQWRLRNECAHAIFFYKWRNNWQLASRPLWSPTLQRLRLTRI